MECDDASDREPCEGTVNLIPCPYEEEVYGFIVPAWLCDRHRSERELDI